MPQKNVHANGRVGRACINTGSQKLIAMQSTAVIEVAEMNAEEMGTITEDNVCVDLQHA